MLIRPRLIFFRVCASGDADFASSIGPANIALLGYTLGAGAAGMVPYTPDEVSVPVTRVIQAPSSTPTTKSFTYTRLFGPLDIPLGLAVSLIQARLADYQTKIGTVLYRGSYDTWAAGSIAGESDITMRDIANYAGTGVPLPAAGTTALTLGSWIPDAT